jgi:hypothetical protein
VFRGEKVKEREFMACRLYRAKMQQTSPEIFKVEEYKTCWNVESMVSVGTTWKCRK